MMKTYLYTMLFALLLTLGSATKADAQTNPSGQTSNGVNNDQDNRTNYQYLGLLGLLGLYGLHKKRVNEGTVVDRKVI